QMAVDAATPSVPSGWRVTRQRDRRQPTGVVDQLVELVPVEHVVDGAGRIHQVHGDIASDGGVVAEHGHEWHHARPPADEQHRSGVVALPHEVATDGRAQFDLVADVEVGGEIRRHLAVVDANDGELELLAAGCRGDRVAALGRVSVFGGEAYVDVLAGPVPGPVGYVQ